MDDENCVVDDNPDENNKPEHRQDIQGLRRDKTVDQGESNKTAGGGRRDADHNDQGIEKTFETGPPSAGR